MGGDIGMQQARTGGGKLWRGLLVCLRSGSFWGLILLLGFASAGCRRKKPAPPTPPPEVEVVTVQPKEAPIYKEWIGTIDGLVNAEIRAQVTGYLQRQAYKEGSRVKEGDLLFEIDPRPFEAALEQVRGKLAQDKAQQSRTQWDVERFEPLAKENAISQQEYNNAVQANLAAQAQVRADEAAVNASQLSLGFTKLTSPINGLAGVALAQIGDLVGPTGPILTSVSTIDQVKVNFNASEQAYLAYRRQYTNEVARGVHEQELEFELILADGSIYPQRGKFGFAGREVNPTTGTIQLIAIFPNPDAILRPGQFARVRARTQMLQNALMVPQRAVSELQGSYQVAVVDPQNKVHLQPVTTGERVGSEWIIEKGINAGDRVVVEGTQKAKEGMLVRPKPFSAQPQSATKA
jgi:membrane fusion protein (multidrug efflux system)